MASKPCSHDVADCSAWPTVQRSGSAITIGLVAGVVAHRVVGPDVLGHSAVVVVLGPPARRASMKVVVQSWVDRW